MSQTISIQSTPSKKCYRSRTKLKNGEYRRWFLPLFTWIEKHDGNCQRIAHGHRSPIELIVNGERDRYREAEFASRWEDIYLGSQEDQVPVAELSLSTRSDEISDQSHYAFKYNAPQGEF